MHQGEKDEAGVFADVIYRPQKLTRAAHQRIGMLLNVEAFKLGKRSLGYGMEGLAGRIRNKMEMKYFTHRFAPNPYILSIKPS